MRLYMNTRNIRISACACIHGKRKQSESSARLMSLLQHCCIFSLDLIEILRYIILLYPKQFYKIYPSMYGAVFIYSYNIHAWMDNFLLSIANIIVSVQLSGKEMLLHFRPTGEISGCHVGKTGVVRLIALVHSLTQETQKYALEKAFKSTEQDRVK